MSILFLIWLNMDGSLDIVKIQSTVIVDADGLSVCS